MEKKGSGLPDNWGEMDQEQRRHYRLNRLLKTDHIPFENDEIKEAYLIRAKRLIDTLNVEEPDRVPVNLPVGSLPRIMYGINSYTALNEPEKLIEAYNQFNEKYSKELEYYASPMPSHLKTLEILDYKLYAWAGYGLSEDAPGTQFIEGEYMMADEYDDLIRDPSNYWFRTYLPRIFGAFESFRFFQPVTNIIEMPMGQLLPFGNPRVRETLKKLIEVSEVIEERSKIMAPHMGKGPSKGFPSVMGGISKAPFDILGDTLRGTKGIMMDMFKKPDKIIEAVEKIADITIDSLLNSPNINNVYMITFPLHKGADGWMSQKQFDTFYWPTFKRVIDALVEQGIIANLFAEGSYNTRLESVNEFPKGAVSWLFDQTDMARAKEILGDKCCIKGNIPASLVITGDPEDVKEYCRKLIEGCGKGGGYVLAPGCNAENPKLENLRAIMEAVREYGVYRN